MFPGIGNTKVYIRQRLIPALLIVVAGILFLNYFLAYRLESYLKREAGERVAEATDGFYMLTFDDLSINLLNGELKIEGIRIEPDTATFRRWEAKDSLPRTYIKATIGQIDFTGVNLIWQWDYRQLDFNTFEIATPTVEIYDAFYSDRFAKKLVNNRFKTLHEFIEPYIDVLTVGQLNVEDASVSFTVEHPLSPIYYKLEQADLRMNHFRLDSNSYNEGKFLYSESMEFDISDPQTLISNDDFFLKTDHILVSTKDSLIKIENIQFIPRKEDWIKNNRYPGHSIEGNIQVIDIEGVMFRRREATNELEARHLHVQSSDIRMEQYFPLSTQPSQSKPMVNDSITEKDSVMPALFLYEVVSPIFHKLAIGQIDISNAILNYSQTTGEKTDSYSLQQFTFRGKDFLLDSLSELKRGLWYVNNFMLDAREIEGKMESYNQYFHVERFRMDTERGNLWIEQAKLEPISHRTRQGYIAGQIDSLRIKGLNYKEGIYADDLAIYSPRVHYGRINTKKSTKEEENISFFSPLLQYIAIRDLSIRNGNLAIEGLNGSQSFHSRVNNLNLHLHHFRINERSWQTSPVLFGYDEYALSFTGLDHLFPGNEYRLKIGKGDLSGRKESLLLQNIQLIPVPGKEMISGKSVLSFQSPEIRVNGLGELLKEWDHIKIDSFLVRSPVVEIIKRDKTSPDNLEQKAEEHTPFQPFKQLQIEKVGIDNTRLSYQDQGSGDTLSVNYKDLAIRKIYWNTAADRVLSMEDFYVSEPDVTWQITRYDSLPPKGKPKTLAEIFYPYAELLKIDRFEAEKIRFQALQPYLQAKIGAEGFIFNSFGWSFMNEQKEMKLASVGITSPTIDIYTLPTPPSPPKAVDDTIQKSIYEQLNILADHMKIDSLRVEEASLDFKTQLNDSSLNQQKLNRTDLSAENIRIDNAGKTFGYENMQFHTENLSLPMSNGFYTLNFGSMDLKDKDLIVDHFHMKSAYPKFDFAYLHPNHKDWFDVTFRKLQIKGINHPELFTEKLFTAREIIVEDPVLLNFKNKKLYTPPKWMPMIWTGLQKAPFKLDIAKIQVNNMGVVYEEISKKGKEPGKLVFTDMNGTLTGVTNIVSNHEQYIRLDADGKFYDNGHFEAVWLIPVDSLNDRFILSAYLPYMDLTLINEMVRPLASAELTGGKLNELIFTMDASSEIGNIDLLLLYENLKVNIFKEENGEIKNKRFLNFLVNAIVRDNNPNKPGKHPRHSVVTIERDPYHSSFNYLWQMLRPSLAESVGISQRQQRMAKGIAGFIGKIKKLFKKDPKEEEVDNQITPSVQTESYPGLSLPD